jgi:rhodanese-related sulfurtransferase
VPYRQGLNEVLAGVLMAGFAAETAGAEPLSDTRASALLSAIVRRFAPRVYAGAGDADMTSLQCALALFRLQLLYHDPALGRHLTGYGVPPELYCVPWFLTFFARGASASVVLGLWDIFFTAAARDAAPGAAVLHSIAVAFVSSHREALLATKTQGTAAADLPALAARLSFRDVAHMRAVAAAGLDVHRRTPLSFRRLIAAVVYGCNSPAPPLPVAPSLLGHLEACLCLRIPVDELLAGSGVRHALAPGMDPPAKLSKASGLRGLELLGIGPGGVAAGLTAADAGPWEESPRYLILDVRPPAAAEYGGRLPTAVVVDPRVLSDADALENELKRFSSLQGVHFAVCGAGDAEAWYLPLSPDSRLSGPSGGGVASEPSTPSQPSEAASRPATPVPPPSGLDAADSSIDDDARALAMLLLQRGFERVAVVAGGYQALHQTQVHFLDHVLVGHEPGFCNLCNPKLAEALVAAQAEVDLAGGARRAQATPSPPALSPQPENGATPRARAGSALGSVFSSASRRALLERSESWLVAGAASVVGSLSSTLSALAEPPFPGTPTPVVSSGSSARP